MGVDMMNKRKLWWLALPVIIIVVVSVVFILRWMQSFSVSMIEGLDNRTTDTWSSSFDNQEERLSFLYQYLSVPSNISLGRPLDIHDAEYHIVYHDNSTGLVPGPSDWDIRVALRIDPEEISIWTEGFEKIDSRKIDISWWDGLMSDNVSWGSPAGTECYKRENDFSYLVVFEDIGVILKAISTMAYPLTSDKPDNSY